MQHQQIFRPIFSCVCVLFGSSMGTPKTIPNQRNVKCSQRVWGAHQMNSKWKGVCVFEWKSNEVSVTEYSAGTDINDVTADDYSVMPLALKIRTILVPHTACTDTGINTPGPCQYVYTIVPCQKHALATSIDIYLSITLMLSQNLPYKLSHNRVSNTFHWYEVLEVLFKPHINIWIKLAQLNHTSERRSTHE